MTEMLKVRQMMPVKFKDKIGRNRWDLDLKKAFGFIPEVIILEKLQGQSNVIQVSAVLTKDEIENEKKRIESEGKKVSGVAESKEATVKETPEDGELQDRKD